MAGSRINTFLKNIGSGWLALLVSGIVGFVTLPMSMKYLGQEQYGVAALVTSLIAMFQYLSFGLPPSILRFLSLAYAKNDRDEVRKILSTSQLIMGALGFLGATGFLFCYSYFVSIYEICEEWRGDVLILFAVTAFNFAESFFLAPYFALIRAKERYDLGNYNRIIASLLRLGTLWCVYTFFERSLRAVALAGLVNSLYTIAAISWIAWRLEGKNILFRFRYVSFDFLPQFFSFSLLNLINTIFYPLTIQGPIMIIGKNLGEDKVAAFAPAVTLASFAASILTSVTSPLTPLASRDLVENKGRGIKEWAVILGELVAWIGCAMIVVLSVVGYEVIELWLGSNLIWILPTVLVMMLGVSYSAIQTSNYFLALGGSTIKPFVYSQIVVAISTTCAAWIGTKYYGWSILGVAISITAIRVIRNTGFSAFAYSRIFGYNYWNYIWRVYCKPTFYAVGVIVVARWLKANYFNYEPSFAFLIIGSAIVASVYGALGWYFNVDAELKKKLPGIGKLPKWGRKALRLPMD